MTYQSIVDRVKEVVEAHYMLADFGYGNLSDIKADEANYPYAFLNPSNHQRTSQSINYRFNLIVMDMVKGQDYLKIQSECQQYIDDILAHLRFGYKDQVDLNLSFTFTPFKERFQDEVAGVTATLDISIPAKLSDCYSPYTPPAPPSCSMAALFVADYATAPEGTTINFSNLSTVTPAGCTTITGYSWSFPGGTPSTSTEENPSVVYYTPGTYDVELCITDGDATACWLRPGYITVSELPCVLTADFSQDKTSVYTGQSVIFTDYSTTTGCVIDGWNWTFEGGTPATSTDQNPVITYNTAGTYDVTLEVTSGSYSGTRTKLDRITVTQAPVYPLIFEGIRTDGVFCANSGSTQYFNPDVEQSPININTIILDTYNMWRPICNGGNFYTAHDNSTYRTEISGIIYRTTNTAQFPTAPDMLVNGSFIQTTTSDWPVDPPLNVEVPFTITWDYYWNTGNTILWLFPDEPPVEDMFQIRYAHFKIWEL